MKVLESLENFLGEVFKQGLGQSPKVLKGGFKMTQSERENLARYVF